MKRRHHILTEYHAITTRHLLDAARGEIDLVERELNSVTEHPSDAILSSLITTLDGAETHGSGIPSDPTFSAYRAYMRERSEMATLRMNLQRERAEILRSIRHMERIVHAVDTWLAAAGDQYKGAITVNELVRRFWHGDSNETIAIAAEYESESTIREWLELVHRQISQLMAYSTTLRTTGGRARPKRPRKLPEKPRQGVLL